MRVSEPHARATAWHRPSIGIGGIVLPLLMAFSSPNATAAAWSASMRLDYQSIPVSGGRTGVLLQRYYLRVTDRLFYKNQLSFTGTFDHRGRQAGQPAEFRPRYELLLTSFGYGGQLVFEPYTQQQSGGPDVATVNRRWRGGLFIQPNRWPRFTYDFTRYRHSQTGQQSDTLPTGRDRWDSYVVSWQPKSNVFGAGYSRQLTTSGGTTGEIVEIYRATASSERTLPWRHHLSMSYNFDRTWSERFGVESNAQDQHAATLNLNGRPAPTVNWSSQYSGRFLTIHRPDSAVVRPTDHDASATFNWVPAKVFNASVARYYEHTGARVGQPAQHTDFVQGRASAEGKLYRQMRFLATVFRIVYMGAPKGARYDDAYFFSLRGKPYRHADWSTEMSLADRHGRQPDRYGGNINTFARLVPLARVQTQIGYTAILSAVKLDAFHVTEESYSTNMQYIPTANMSLAGTWAIHRARPTRSKWTPVWSATGTCRWPSFASLSVNYSQRELIAPATVTTVPTTWRHPSTLLGNIVWWIGPNSTVTAQYTRQEASDGTKSENWGVSVSTSF
jgi:hypothetical protein